MVKMDENRLTGEALLYTHTHKDIIVNIELLDYYYEIKVLTVEIVLHRN
jgi:hypothetical protein